MDPTSNTPDHVIGQAEGNRSLPPISRRLRHWDRWMGQALAGGGKEVPGIGGDIECALAACLNDAERGGIASTAFIGAGSEADLGGR